MNAAETKKSLDRLRQMIRDGSKVVAVEIDDCVIVTFDTGPIRIEAWSQVCGRAGYTTKCLGQFMDENCPGPVGQDWFEHIRALPPGWVGLLYSDAAKASETGMAGELPC